MVNKHHTLSKGTQNYAILTCATLPQGLHMSLFFPICVGCSAKSLTTQGERLATSP